MIYDKSSSLYIFLSNNSKKKFTTQKYTFTPVISRNPIERKILIHNANFSPNIIPKKDPPL